MLECCDIGPLVAIQNNAVKVESKRKVENHWVLVSTCLGKDLRIAIEYANPDAQ